MPSEYAEKDNLRLLPFNAGKAYATWVRPTKSHLYNSDRNRPNEAISQIIAGSDPLTVTPLKMAEMYGKLFSGNKDFQVKMGDFAKQDLRSSESSQLFKAFSVDDSWKNSEWSSFVKEYILKGMKESVRDGTSRLPLGTLQSEYSDFEFYAKTGTGSGESSLYGDSIDNKHFAVVITQRNFIDNYANPNIENKFIVVYFALHNVRGGHHPELKREMIRSILGSPSVKAYFRND